MDSTAFIEKLRANLYTNLRKQGSMTGGKSASYKQSS